MGWIQKVVAHQQIIAVQFHCSTAVYAPGRIIVVFNLENLGDIGQCGIAHPDPDQPVFFMQRIGMDPRL